MYVFYTIHIIYVIDTGCHQKLNLQVYFDMRLYNSKYDTPRYIINIKIHIYMCTCIYTYTYMIVNKLLVYKLKYIFHQ